MSPDEGFEEIIGVSDTFVPGINVWVGEYPYLDKVRQWFIASNLLQRLFDLRIGRSVTEVGRVALCGVHNGVKCSA